MTHADFGNVLTVIALPAVAMAIVPLYSGRLLPTRLAHRISWTLCCMVIAAPFLVSAAANWRREFVMYDPEKIVLVAFFGQIITLPIALGVVSFVAYRDRAHLGAWSVAAFISAALYAGLFVFVLLNLRMH